MRNAETFREYELADSLHLRFGLEAETGNLAEPDFHLNIHPCYAKSQGIEEHIAHKWADFVDSVCPLGRATEEQEEARASFFYRLWTHVLSMKEQDRLDGDALSRLTSRSYLAATYRNVFHDARRRRSRAVIVINYDVLIDLPNTTEISPPLEDLLEELRKILIEACKELSAEHPEYAHQCRSYIAGENRQAPNRRAVKALSKALVQYLDMKETYDNDLDWSFLRRWVDARGGVARLLRSCRIQSKGRSIYGATRICPPTRESQAFAHLALDLRRMGLKYKAISSKLGITVNAAKVRVHRERKKELNAIKEMDIRFDSAWYGFFWDHRGLQVCDDPT